MRWLKLWKLQRRRLRLAELLRRDRELRSAPGQTTVQLVEQMVSNGREIAALRFEIKIIEGQLHA